MNMTETYIRAALVRQRTKPATAARAVAKEFRRRIDAEVYDGHLEAEINDFLRLVDETCEKWLKQREAPQ